MYPCFVPKGSYHPHHPHVHPRVYPCFEALKNILCHQDPALQNLWDILEAAWAGDVASDIDDDDDQEGDANHDGLDEGDDSAPLALEDGDALVDEPEQGVTAEHHDDDDDDGSSCPTTQPEQTPDTMEDSPFYKNGSMMIETDEFGESQRGPNSCLYRDPHITPETQPDAGVHHVPGASANPSEAPGPSCPRGSMESMLPPQPVPAGYADQKRELRDRMAAIRLG